VSYKSDCKDSISKELEIFYDEYCLKCYENGRECCEKPECPLTMLRYRLVDRYGNHITDPNLSLCKFSDKDREEAKELFNRIIGGKSGI